MNVPNFGPGADPGVLRQWARTVEELGLDLLMMSDHVAVTPDVAEQYPAPFYEPFTTLSYLAGMTSRVRLGTTVLVVPYRHPLVIARMAANLNDLSGGRLVLGVGVGWARQEFEALGIPFQHRGKLTDEHLVAMREAWRDDGYRAGDIPIWIGGNSDAAVRRAKRFGAAWHPLRFAMPWIRERSTADMKPRIVLRLTDEPVTDPGRLAGEGTIEQVVADLDELRALGADTVVLDPFDPADPEVAWRDIATVMAHKGME